MKSAASYAGMMMWSTLIAAVVALSGIAAGAVPSLIDQIAGVYKDRFPNGNVDGTEYTSENVLEIVKLSPARAYVRAHLEFYNGHQCNIHGLAHLEAGALVYRTPALIYRNQKEVDGTCVLTLRKRDTRIELADQDNICKDNFCGMRGSFEGESSTLSRRRPIRYMKRLLSSREYAEAIAEEKK